MDKCHPRAKKRRGFASVNLRAIVDGEKASHPWFNLSIQKNPPSVTIYDEAALPFEYVAEVTTTKVDKAAIKAALLDGVEVVGAKLSNGTRLVIR